MKFPPLLCLSVSTLLLAGTSRLAAEDELSPGVALEIDVLRSTRDDLRVAAGLPVKELDTKYQAALERLGEQARSAGKFPVVVAANDSLKEFTQAGIPNGESENPELVKMEKVYLEQLAKIKEQARPGFVKLEKDYAGQLTRVAAALTQKNETADALLVQKQIKREEAFIKRLEGGMAVPIGKAARIAGDPQGNVRQPLENRGRDREGDRACGSEEGLLGESKGLGCGSASPHGQAPHRHLRKGWQAP
jgi:hypothetical protein